MLKWNIFFILVNCVNVYLDDVKCREWVLDGECVINFVWMIVNCVSDCYMCKNNESLLDGGMKMM